MEAGEEHGSVEPWNREALYLEVWSQPLTKLATKYRISNVMLGKVCRKLALYALHPSREDNRFSCLIMCHHGLDIEQVVRPRSNIEV